MLINMKAHDCSTYREQETMEHSTLSEASVSHSPFQGLYTIGQECTEGLQEPEVSGDSTDRFSGYNMVVTYLSSELL